MMKKLVLGVPLLSGGVPKQFPHPLHIGLGFQDVTLEVLRAEKQGSTGSHMSLPPVPHENQCIPEVVCCPSCELQPEPASDTPQFLAYLVSLTHSTLDYLIHRNFHGHLYSYSFLQQMTKVYQLQTQVLCHYLVVTA